MSTALAKTETYDAIDRAIGHDLLGDLLRFNGKTGRFFRGPDKIEMPLKSRLKYAPLSVQDGYQKWIDGHIEDERWHEWNSTQPPISRNDLGDLDEGLWLEGKDPWSFTLRAAFKDTKGVLLKFVTTSAGGINAIRRLMRDWRQERGEHSGLDPVVELGTDTYLHKVHRTEITTPTFTIVNWAPWDGEAMKAIASAHNEPPPPHEGSYGAELDDAIPFAPEWRG